MTEFLAYLDQFGFWAWWIAAGALVLLEVLAPGAIFLWLGIAAAVVGGLVFFMPDLDWKAQLAVFAVLSIASIVVSKRYLKSRPIETDHPTLNQRGQQLVGRELVLAKPIVGGRGRIEVGDSGWAVEGPDLPAGTRVRVSGVNGATLEVVNAEE